MTSALWEDALVTLNMRPTSVSHASIQRGVAWFAASDGDGPGVSDEEGDAEAAARQARGRSHATASTSGRPEADAGAPQPRNKVDRRHRLIVALNLTPVAT